MIGLDTSAIIDLFKGDSGIYKFIEKNKEPLALSTASYIELHFGINPDRRSEEEEYFDSLFDDSHTIDITRDVSKRASRIHWELKKKGKMIDQFDCLIAASFLEYGVKKIVTRNVKHFNKITDIKVIEY